VKELLELYVADGQRYLLDILTAHATKSAAALKNSAHALKGSTQNLGGDRLAAVCRLLEEQALSGDFERAGVLVEEVGKEFKVFTELLQADVDKGGTA
jgi:HPt (histidine-containing phosphotransfer) domain-containing protein